jgi:hypothetical protein
MTERITRITLEQARKLRGLSDSKRINQVSDEEIDKIIDSDPDLHHLTDEELAQFKLARNRKNDRQK